ncbi:MFS transporter [Thalassococcus sp. S3]|uniref:MFS transporter n=1 Tax=Thalassococcus sp. S3 TaxID=2017482 RepID=UPI0013EE65D6|nr:MFS transporter [Thalassococcus sp. S3]
MTTLTACADNAQTCKSATRGLTPIVSAALFLEAMTVSITAIAIPNMKADFDSSLAVLQWTHGAFIIGFAGLLLLGGRVADLYGRRRVFLISTALFGLASLIVALAPSLGLLFTARGIQGAAAAFMIPTSISILTGAFPEGPARNRALGTFNAAGAAGFSVGLVIGGLLIAELGWRWAFGLNFPASVLIVAVGMSVIPAARVDRKSVKLDWFGAATVAAAISTLTLALTLGAEHGFGVLELGLVAAAVLLCGLFVWTEKIHAEPLMPLSMLRIPGLRRSSLASLTLLGAFFGFNLLVSVALQTGHGMAADMAGFALLPMGLLCVAVAQIITPRVMDRFDIDRVAASGLGLIALASAWLFSAGSLAPLWLVIAAATVAGGLGMGLAYAPLAVGAVRGVELDRQGVAAGLQQTTLQVGGVIGIALAIAASTLANRPEAGLLAAALIALAGVAVLTRRTTFQPSAPKGAAQ